MSSIWNELDVRLSMVPRWTVVVTIQKQTVSQHCFNVERIARRIAEQWLNITNPVVLDQISQAALHHDDEEAIIGDMPSPAKKYLREDYLDEQGRLWYDTIGRHGDIIKLADKMEAYQFLCLDRMLGNLYVAHYIGELFDKITKSAQEIGVQDRALSWMASVSKLQGTTHGPTAGSTD